MPHPARTAFSFLNILWIGLPLAVSAQTVGSAGTVGFGGHPLPKISYLTDSVGVVYSDSSVIAFVRDEGVSNSDFNGDGDSDDFVLHTWDKSRRQVLNLGISVGTGGYSRSGDTFAFTGYELSNGVDFNMDGDLFDNVVHLADLSTGIVRNLGIATVQNGVALSGQFLVISVDEQSDNIDWLGDGDQLDTVYLVGTLSGTTLTPLPFASSSLDGAVFKRGSKLILRAKESSNSNVSIDITGDGDTLDSFAVIVDTATFAADVFPYPGYLQVTDGFVHTFVDEPKVSRDLNGDADLDDSVLVLQDLATGMVTTSPFALPLPSPVQPNSSYSLETALGFNAAEADLQLDLNGDGDLSDLFFIVHDLEQGTVHAVEGFASRAGEPRRRQIAIIAGESTTPVSNGDSDSFDSLAVTLDLDSGALVYPPLAAATQTFAAQVEDLQLVLTDEARQGGQDLDGDGDASDSTLMVYDSRTGTLVSSGLSYPLFSPFLPRQVGNWILFAADETAGRADLNADGDLDDALFVFLDPDSLEIADFRLLQGSGFSPVPAGTLQTLVTLEEAVGDRNGDGDSDDTVLAVIE